MTPNDVLRKAGNVVRDPVLRTWLLRRVAGLEPAPPAFEPHRPPYLGAPAAVAPAELRAGFPKHGGGAPQAPIALDLPAATVRLDPAEAEGLFERTFEDRETFLAVHRFAWIARAAQPVDPAWIARLWEVWWRRFGAPTDDWPWHPYTAAERAINILRFARENGLPDEERSLRALADHGTAIAGRLEYFGEHDTSNHLTNNGRGLYWLGLELGTGAWADMGAEILLREPARVLGDSGVLREGSSHYQLLYAFWYRDAAALAARHGRPEAADLAAIAQRLAEVVPRLRLPGGLPLIGDISPDRAPDSLVAEFADIDADAAADAEALRRDGWLRADFDAWAGLWHLPPRGWPTAPGHGHRDAGGFELHFDGTPLFVDIGRGTYGGGPDAAFDQSGAAHNLLTVDGVDPYPENKPYYGDAFRARVGGPAPILECLTDGVRIHHDGFSRLSGVGRHTREMRFSGSRLEISDRVEGRGRHQICRRLHTGCPVETTADGPVVAASGRRFLVEHPDGEAATVRQSRRWTDYGRGAPAHVLDLTISATLPWEGRTIVREIGA